MPAGLQQAGVQAVITGLSQFMSGMGQINKATQQLSTSLQATQTASTTAGTAVAKTLGAGATTAAGSIGALASVLGGPVGLVIAIGAVGMAAKAAGDKIGALINKTIQLTRKIGDGIFQATLLAGRFQELENAAIAIGFAMGVSEQETRGAIETMKELGIRTDVAATVVSDFARNQIDMANATDLVRVAQAAGIRLSEDSSDAMQKLTFAVTTGNTEMLRRMGLTTALLTSTDALSQGLTEAERVQENVNRIVAAGAATLGVYDAAMESPTKRMRSLTQRLIPELTAGFGQFFLPALNDVVGALSNLVKGLTAAVSEGGVLYPLMIKLGAVASILADVFEMAATIITQKFDRIANAIDRALGTTLAELSGFSVSMHQTLGATLVQLATMVSNWTAQFVGGFITGTIKMISAVLDFGTYLADTFMWIIRTAFSWGSAITQAIAEGLAAGAQAIVQVIQAIADIFTGWFAPGSPPKIAPEIDKWGLQTIEEWLGAMTKADFGILDKLQGFLKGFLDPSAFKNISGSLIEALGGTGPVDEGLFEQLRTVGGDVGPAIERLARTQFDYARATEEAAQAQRDLDDAQRRFLDAGQEVDALTQDYNALLRAGADPAILKTRLAEINAAEEQERLALEEQKQAEQRKADAEERAALLKEQMGLQEDTVQQLLKLLAEVDKATAEVDKATTGAGTKAGKKGAGGGGAGPFQGLVDAAAGAGAGITNNIGKAIAEMKANLLETLGGIFEPLRTKWEEDIKPALESLAERWRTFSSAVISAWNTAWVVLDIGFILLQNWLTVLLPKAITDLEERWKEFKIFLVVIFIKAVEKVIEKIGTLYEDFLSLADTITNTVLVSFMGLVTHFEETFIGTVASVGRAIMTLVNGALEKLRLKLGRIRDWLRDILRYLRQISGFFDSPGSGGGGGSGANLVAEDATSGGASETTLGTGTVSAPVVSGGTNQISLNFGPITIANGMDQAEFQAAVMDVVTTAVRTG